MPATRLALAGEADAQDETVAAPRDAGVMEEIVVTGSRIKRRDFFTPSPLTTVSQEAISFNGLGTLEEMLNQMPQVGPSMGRTSNNPGDGTAAVDLRALGPERTLALLNGRRFGENGVSTAIDVNNIPQFLIDRVEIITGGTSAVYGSDAIAGVVNFITRKDFDGFAYETSTSTTQHRDASTYNASLAWGAPFADDHGHVVLYGNWYKRDELMTSDRAFTRVLYLDDWEGNLVESGSSTTPAGVINYPQVDLGTGPVNITFDPDGTPRDFVWEEAFYNYAPANYLQIPLERHAAGLFGQYRLSSALGMYVEASWTRNEPGARLAPVPTGVSVEVNLDNPVLAPVTRQFFADHYTCDTNLACFQLRKRPVELGYRDLRTENDLTRLLWGVNGDLGAWEFDAWLTYTNYSNTTLMYNALSNSRIQQGLLVDPVTGECVDPSGGCVPLNLFGEGTLSREGAAFIRVPVLRESTDVKNKMASAFVRGSPLDTWAGPLGVALGAEWRSVEVNYRPDLSIDEADSPGWSPGTPISGTDTVAEVYLEAVIPLAANRAWAHYLGIELGSRYSKYKYAGSLRTYKLGGEWQPVDALRFRVMRQRSARAPNARDMFQAQSEYEWQLNIDDPCSASNDPAAEGLTDKCILQGLAPDQVGVFEQSPNYPVTFRSGGNPALRPEIANTWTGGMVITPSRLAGLNVSIDYFDIELKDTIGGIDAMTICFDPLNTANVFCNDITRDVTGNISTITELTSNRGLARTSGVDVQVDYHSESLDWMAPGSRYGEIRANLYWTYLRSHKVQENVTTKVLECAGKYGWPCWGYDQSDTFPRNRITSAVHYTSGPLVVQLTGRWIQGTANAAPLQSAIWGIPNPDLAIPRVQDEHYLDLGVAYEFSPKFTVRFGIDNLEDNDPPLMADEQFGASSDYGMYDVFGRSCYLTLSGEF